MSYSNSSTFLWDSLLCSQCQAVGQTFFGVTKLAGQSSQRHLLKRKSPNVLFPACLLYVTTCLEIHHELWIGKPLQCRDHQKSFRSQSKAVPVRDDVEKRAKKTKEIRSMGLRRGAWEHDVFSVVTWGRPLINFVVGILRLTRQ